jgi:hypothetical protein
LSFNYSTGEIDMEEDLQNSTISNAEVLAFLSILDKILGSMAFVVSACTCSLPLELDTFGVVHG